MFGTVVIQVIVHQSPVFDCLIESDAGQTEARDGKQEGRGGGGRRGCF